MKKNLVLLLMVLFTISASQAVAYEYDYGVSVGDEILWNGAHVGYGGEFGMTVVNPADDNFGFSWSTFCVEIGQYLDNTMTVSNISDANTLSVPLSEDVAWLYWNFSQGTLTGYDGSTNDQNDLQMALWNSLGMTPPGGYIVNDQAQVNNWLDLAADDYADGWTNDGLVQVLNLGGAQDVLVAATNPVPEPASMVLLGVGLAGLALVSRRKKNN